MGIFNFFKKSLPKKSNEIANQQESSEHWYSFLTDEEKKQFEFDVNAYFSKKGNNFKVNFNEGFVSGDNKQHYGLQNIAQYYHKAKDSEKPKLVSNHFDILFQSNEEEKKIIAQINDFTAIKPYLAVRVYPSDYATVIGGEKYFVNRRDFADSITALVLDLPSKIRTLKPEEIKPWNIPSDKLFSIGIENIVNLLMLIITE